MRPRWKLTVEGLGKIEHAEVDVHPLMLFVGENNSGKSYLASLLWGLFARQGYLASYEGPELKLCQDWLEKRIKDRIADNGYLLAEEDQALFVGLFDAMLASDKSRLIQRVLNSESADVKTIEFRSMPPAMRIMELYGDQHGAIFVHAHMNDGVGEWSLKAPAAHMPRALAAKVVLGKLGNYFPMLLPASRSGFMLLYPAVVGRQLKLLELEERAAGERLNLTLPAVRLVELLAMGIKKDRGDFAEEADFLEAGLDGRIELVKGAVGINDYLYQPTGSSAQLPMSLSSSLVTELAPIILVLRHMKNFPILIIEEPEAHLHPKLQRKLAQVIVRLIRKGLYVWITTHSENFCQQINNFMKIGTLRERGVDPKDLGLGYGEQDYLTMDDIAGYEFKLKDEGRRSVVSPLKKTEEGLVMPTFNWELFNLGKEVDVLERKLEEFE